MGVGKSRLIVVHVEIIKIGSSINNNTKVNFRRLTTVNLLLPTPVQVKEILYVLDFPLLKTNSSFSRGAKRQDTMQIDF